MAPVLPPNGEQLGPRPLLASEVAPQRLSGRRGAPGPGCCCAGVADRTGRQMVRHPWFVTADAHTFMPPQICSRGPLLFVSHGQLWPCYDQEVCERGA